MNDIITLKMSVILFLVISVYKCQGNSTDNNNVTIISNTTIKNDSSNNTTLSEDDSIVKENNITIPDDYDSEQQYCINIKYPKTLLDCNPIIFNYTACCILNLTYPYSGQTCVPIDFTIARNSSFFNLTINPKTSLQGDIKCNSRILEISILWIFWIILYL